MRCNNCHFLADEVISLKEIALLKNKLKRAIDRNRELEMRIEILEEKLEKLLPPEIW